VLILVQGIMTGPLSKKYGERALIRAGLLGGAAGFALVAMAVDYATMLLAVAFFILALGLIGPALNSHISAHAGENQGTVMGMSSAMNSLGRVIGPLWGGYIYEINYNYPFFSGAATLMLGLLLSMAGLRMRTG